jgi:predicted secreted protein
MKQFDEPTQTIRVAPGEDFALVLAGNPTTGYSWQAEVDEECLQPLGREFEPRGSGIGAGGREVLRFRALQAGETEIKLEYKRPWQAEARETRQLAVKIA